MELRYRPAGKTLRAFMRSDAFIQGIRGPFGSGKSTAAVCKILKCAAKQVRCRDGLRRSRWVVVRNTYPELKTTTIKTWHQWVPPTVGRWVDSGPPRHELAWDDVRLEVEFLALDRPQDVAKLLSYEPTAAWINEAREAPKVVVDHLSGRVGRYPPVAMLGSDGQGWSGLLMDTNSPDTDHWWYEWAEDLPPAESKRLEELRAALVDLGALRPDQKLMEWFAQPSGRSAEAENVENLVAGYYVRLQAGKKEDWIRVYVDGEYGFVADGKPVFPSYRDHVHCREFEIPAGAGLIVGLDFGLTPAASILVPRGGGAFGIHGELVSSGLSIVQFADELKAYLAAEYPRIPVTAIWGDPSGDTRQSGDEQARTIFEILRARGVDAWPAPGQNDPVQRVGVVEDSLNRLVGGEPGLVISKRAKVTRKGYGGKYQYARVQVGGGERYQDKPVKNPFSHVCEASEYALLGAGQGTVLVRPRGRRGDGLQATAES